jgi:hypothetical protein
MFFCGESAWEDNVRDESKSTAHIFPLVSGILGVREVLISHRQVSSIEEDFTFERSCQNLLPCISTATVDLGDLRWRK